ncbi:MAG: TIR domain-containing protein [Verrucomicrobia bacterium]|nr:TIR domain-containing protein [Verrucomicrobiota bacterium]MBV9658122.1 TIR domain-containing protein [Verrucomicrobiota bacterium]
MSARGAGGYVIGPVCERVEAVLMDPESSPAPGPSGGWKEEDWEDLLDNIEEGRVIPIVGRDMLQITPAGGAEPVPLHRYLAERLAESLGLRPEELRGDFTLSHVVSMGFERGKPYSYFCRRLLELLRPGSFETPAPLRHLAEITHFNLFVTTTFDSLLEQALNEKRPAADGDSAGAEVGVYDPSQPAGHADQPGGDRELDYARKHPGRPIVYHLMGRLAGSSDTFGLTDEDLLEYVGALQSENRKPERLFTQFENNHLLLLGCGFSDWLARFFLRAAKGSDGGKRRFSEKRKVIEYVVDDNTMHDRELVLFLKNFSKSTQIYQIYRSGEAIHFVKELRDRWVAKHPEAIVPPAPRPAAARFAEPPTEMPPGAIFISYASEDIAAVRRLKAGLDAHGLPAWFDKEQLKPGDAYNTKINHYIESCRLFLPVISAHTERRYEGYFRQEWRLAAKRSLRISHRRPFIVPVVVDDDIDEAGANVPDEFVGTQWTRLRDAEVSDAFATQLAGLLNQVALS